MTSREALVALNMLPKIGPVRVRRLMDYFGSAESILSAPIGKLTSVDGIGPETAEIIRGWEERIDLANELREVEARGLKIVTQEDESFPEALKQSYDPPLLLYVWGELKEVDRHAIAIVGSRKTTHYGTQTARQFAFQLATSGMTVVSGLARGIDTHAHEGAVAAKGRTIAVIGSGLGQIYPPENMALAEKIASGSGAVVSEFPLNMPPSKKTFPMRNRIVAAWSQAVLVVECPEWSGARITANLAGELGKPIYAVPGQIDRPSSAGCHALIREGAALVTSGQDILDDISVLPLQENTVAQESSRPPLAPDEQKIIDAVENGASLVDELLLATQLSLPEINASLLKLEIQGRVQQLPGSRFALK
ncbi:MAG: DNA-processing protein DprA [Akkermansiaceae bacterium]